MNPAQAGGGAIGDIGTHAYNLTGFVTGLHTQALSAALQGYVPGQSVDNDARVTLQYDGGRTRTYLGQPGGDREREQPDLGDLWLKSIDPVGAGKPEYPLVYNAQ